MEFNKIDEIINEIELIFLKNTSIKEDHNGQYIEYEIFLSEMRELIKKKFFSFNNNPVQRWSIREILKPEYSDYPDENKKHVMIGIEYNFDDKGNWVLYNDFINLVEDHNLILNKINQISDILKGNHRIIN